MYFTYQNVLLRHGQDTQYFADDLYDDTSLTTRNIANSIFLDGHYERLTTPDVVKTKLYFPKE